MMHSSITKQPPLSRETCDLLRMLSICAVLIIHATAGAEIIFHKNHLFFSTGFFAVLLNQMARFAVPIFILLSGYGLAQKQSQSTAKFSTKAFYQRRTKKIVLPFIFISLIILLLLNKFGWHSNQSFIKNIFNNVNLLGKTLLYGSADYHLYFLSIIIQCYLLFPLLRKLESRIIWLLLLIMQIILTSPSHVLLHKLGIKLPNFHSSFFIYWVFYFYTGILITKKQLFPKKALAKRWTSTIILLISFALVMLDYIWRSWSNPLPDYYNHFNRQTVILFTLAVLFFFSANSNAISTWLSNKHNSARFIINMSGLSFSVYLLHTQLLRILEAAFTKNRSLLLVATLIPFSFGTIWLISKALKKPRFLRGCIGLPPTLQKKKD